MDATPPIFLDNNSTTPMDSRVFESMKPYFLTRFGNAASQTHRFGIEAEAAINRARMQVAECLGAQPNEIIWTSGATEANNLAIKGFAYANRSRGQHLITQQTEHSSVVDSFKRLEKEGFRVTWLPVDQNGRISPDAVHDAIGPDTLLVSVMWANNETGTIEPIERIAEICQNSGVVLHSDATQAVAKIPINLRQVPVDLLSFSGHKIYGPKGCGALILRQKSPRLKIQALIDGGGHERGYRSGTLNVPGIVGTGRACEIGSSEMSAEAARLAAIRDCFEAELLEGSPQIFVNGDRDHRLPHVSNLSFKGVDSESLMLALENIAMSSGSACTSVRVETSHVLKAMGIPDELSRCAIRISFGRFNVQQEASQAARQIIDTVNLVRQLKPQVA